MGKGCSPSLFHPHGHAARTGRYVSKKSHSGKIHAPRPTALPEARDTEGAYRAEERSRSYLMDAEAPRADPAAKDEHQRLWDTRLRCPRDPTEGPPVRAAERARAARMRVPIAKVQMTAAGRLVQPGDFLLVKYVIRNEGGRTVYGVRTGTQHRGDDEITTSATVANEDAASFVRELLRGFTQKELPVRYREPEMAHTGQSGYGGRLTPVNCGWMSRPSASRRAMTVISDAAAG